MENLISKSNLINNEYIFNYLIISILIMFIFKKLSLKIESLVILIIAFFIFKFFIDNKYQNNLDGIVKTQNLLKSLNAEKDFLHYDQNLIYFFDFIKEYKIYNLNDYNKLIDIINNILRIESDLDIGTQYCKYDVDTAILLKKNAIDKFHSFIHSLPSNKLNNSKHTWSLNELNRLLTLHLNNIINKCKTLSSKKDINTQTFFTDTISNIYPYDPNINLNYNFII